MVKKVFLGHILVKKGHFRCFSGQKGPFQVNPRHFRDNFAKPPVFCNEFADNAGFEAGTDRGSKSVQ